LHLWGKLDFAPRPEDTFQERLYCVQWITKDSVGAGRQETYFAGVTDDDLARERRVLSSNANCNPPRRFDIGKVVQDLKECCHAILFASVGGRKRPDRRFAGRGAVDGGDCPGARSGESHHLPGAAAERTPFGRVLAASRRRSLSIAQA